jgi:uncharacterized membrane protein YfcA
MAVVALGFLAGGAAGAHLASRLRGRGLALGFVAFQVTVAALLLARARGG